MTLKNFANLLKSSSWNIYNNKTKLYNIHYSLSKVFSHFLLEILCPIGTKYIFLHMNKLFVNFLAIFNLVFNLCNKLFLQKQKLLHTFVFFVTKSFTSVQEKSLIRSNPYIIIIRIMEQIFEICEHCFIFSSVSFPILIIE